MTLQFALTVALRAMAIIGAGSTARLAYEHHAVRAAALTALRVVSVGHGRRSRPVSWPHPLRQRHRGTRIAPRPAREAATA